MVVAGGVVAGVVVVGLGVWNNGGRSSVLLGNWKSMIVRYWPDYCHERAERENLGTVPEVEKVISG